MDTDFAAEPEKSSRHGLGATTAAILAVAAASVFVAGGIAGAWWSGRDDKTPGPADIGFVQDMIDHHEQAILMSQLLRAGDVSPDIRRVADDVIASQRYELGMMDAWLREWERDRGQPGREAMAWMGHPVAVEEMPGMASAADLQDLQRAAGADREALFLRLMTEHHNGGVHMGEAAQTRADHPSIRWLAGQMAQNQRREIRDMEAAEQILRELRRTSPPVG